jgi:hypothetical protein
MLEGKKVKNCECFFLDKNGAVSIFYYGLWEEKRSTIQHSTKKGTSQEPGLSKLEKFAGKSVFINIRYSKTQTFT